MVIKIKNGVAKKFDKNKYDIDYQKDNYDQVRFLVPKGKKELLKALASDNDISVNTLIKQAIEDKYDITL